MRKLSWAAFAGLLFTAVLLSTNIALAQQAAPPALGTSVPDAIARAPKEPLRCLTAESHYDPCAWATIANVRYVVAWDQDTNKISYLFTADAGFHTPSNLAVGGQVRVLRSRLVPYKSWQIDPRSVSGGWFPVVAPLDLPSIVGGEDETNAVIIGFLQTIYLNERTILP